MSKKKKRAKNQLKNEITKGIFTVLEAEPNKSFNYKQVASKLSINDTEAGSENDTEGVVEFVARFKVQGRGHRLRERSRFERIEGRWYYLDGEHLD